MTDAPIAPRRPMDDNKGLGEGMTSVDIYCHRQHKGQWQEEADEQGLSLSRYLVELVQEARWQRINDNSDEAV